jgi:hypothetical protein
MGGLGDIFADAVEAARIGVESAQVEVTYRPWLGQSVQGEPDLGERVTLSALVTEGEIDRPTGDGKSVKARAFVLLFPPASGSTPPAIKLRDWLELPSGYKGPITGIGDAMRNPATGDLLLRALWLG